MTAHQHTNTRFEHRDCHPSLCPLFYRHAARSQVAAERAHAHRQPALLAYHLLPDEGIVRLSVHPRSREIEVAVRVCLGSVAAWSGHAYRMVEAPWANIRDLLSGEGAGRFGQRWNPPGIATIYACLGDDMAMCEWYAQRKRRA
jgi:hypothetical protein